MKLLQQREETAKDKKFIKSQVEKRRRERMNSSLEHLRTMLVQGPQNLDGTRGRVEKAEILEHTVLFLQKTAKEEQSSAGGGGGGGGARGRQKHSFQEGVSTCLQRAAQFLGPEGKGLWLGGTLDSSFAARFSHLDSGFLKKPGADSSSSSLSHTKSILRMLRQKSKHRLQAGAKSFSHQYQLPGQREFPTVPQQAQTQNESRVESRGGKQSPSMICPAAQTIWRPWP